VNFRQIEVFHSVYVSGSITAAARALHVSQPSVSKTLQHTEKRLGFALFRRLKGRLVATEEAHHLFREVDEVYQRVGSLKLTARNLRAGGAGHVRVAVLPALGLGVAPRAIARFRTRNPGVTFDVQTIDHADIARCLYERDCDIAVAFTSPTHPRLTGARIGSGELVLLERRPGPAGNHSGASSARASASASTSASERIDIRKLKNRDYISLTGSGPIGALLAAELSRLELPLTEVAAVRTFYVAAALVRHGVGVAVVDEFTARAMLTPELSFQRLSPAIAFDVQCVWLEDKPPSRTCQRFIDALTEDLKAL
jgi:DNA-binding transcriptional LysR family regulator